MREIHLNDYVRLNFDLPELDLQKGDIGVVRGECPSPTMMLDVEFHHVGRGTPIFAHLYSQDVALEDGPLFDSVRIQNEELITRTND